MKKCKS